MESGFDPYCFCSSSSRAEVMSLFKRPNMIVCEVGVDRGQFSEELLRHLDPAELHLVDLWEGADDAVPGSGHHTFLDDVKGKFSDNKVVRIHQSNSVDAASLFADNSIDIAYIDADHGYEAALADLIAYMPKITERGVLAGHDFVDIEVLRMQKKAPSEKFGVMEAVSTFCRRYNFRMIALSMDITPSFFLVGPKNPMHPIKLGEFAVMNGFDGFFASQRRLFSLSVHYFRTADGGLKHISFF
jgi:hypothetical protein